jgi:hypothetical protein
MGNLDITDRTITILKTDNKKTSADFCNDDVLNSMFALISMYVVCNQSLTMTIQRSDGCRTSGATGTLGLVHH